MPSGQSVKDSTVYLRKAGLNEVSAIAKSLFTGNSENYKMNLKVTGVHLVPGNGWMTKKTLRTDNNIKYVYISCAL